eukprot:2210540-Pyramimonas_sp.AAC.1
MQGDGWSVVIGSGSKSKSNCEDYQGVPCADGHWLSETDVAYIEAKGGSPGAHMCDTKRAKKYTGFPLYSSRGPANDSLCSPKTLCPPGRVPS